MVEKTGTPPLQTDNAFSGSVTQNLCLCVEAKRALSKEEQQTCRLKLEFDLVANLQARKRVMVKVQEFNPRLQKRSTATKENCDVWWYCTPPV
ncbi:hypothetical protein L2E82_39261 [Cichorium intybus]|uniref:Uncharacterized protein n=1 Tax=Cichorium intybus TaxID=13427 RepID=A0ACB9AH06_CICIN|nr:hypothetical protein L2E82_39261 [Cichorium intybus]